MSESEFLKIKEIATELVSGLEKRFQDHQEENRRASDEVLRRINSIDLRIWGVLITAIGAILAGVLK